MHVSGDRPEVSLIFDQFGTVASLENMPGKPVPSRPNIGVARQKRLHPRARLGWGVFRSMCMWLGMMAKANQVRRLA